MMVAGTRGRAHHAGPALAERFGRDVSVSVGDNQPIQWLSDRELGALFSPEQQKKRLREDGGR